jgi:hypothetical protein
MIPRRSTVVTPELSSPPDLPVTGRFLKVGDERPGRRINVDVIRQVEAILQTPKKIAIAGRGLVINKQTESGLRRDERAIGYRIEVNKSLLKLADHGIDQGKLRYELPMPLFYFSVTALFEFR